MKSIIILSILVSLVAGCAQSRKPDASAQSVDAGSLVDKGLQMLSAGSFKQAIVQFDLAIAQCKQQYPEGKQQVYTARGPAESLYYMVIAAANNQDAIAVDTTCSDARYFRGFATLDLGDIELAQTYVKQAIAMAPNNSLYLSELGHIHQTKQEWADALNVFKEAEDAAESFSPDVVKDKELARAKRGVGYNLIELGKLDEAENKFNEVLQLNPDDKSALNEIQYIQKLRQSQSAN